MSAQTLAALRAGQLAGATRLSLRAGLREFPSEVFTLADSLEVLDLSGNGLSALPADLHRLHRLRVLFASDNEFTELPAALGSCAALEMVGFKANRIASVPADALPPRLRWLILTDNRIEALPEALGRCTRLQKLMLAGNALSALPAALAHCQSLALVRLAANRFAALPDWLPRLPRLAWLAVGGNPLCTVREQAALDATEVPLIDPAQLQLAQVLGEGASGVIHAAQWQQPGGAAAAIALKRFRGTVTSDGWPASELAAALAAGTHAGLIPLLGRVAATPGQGTALALARLGPEWQALASPPSFDSCTRDVYAPGIRFEAGTVRRLAREIAASVAHLHARGIVHGDLYAHNILWRPEGAADEGPLAVLSDFGAAALPPDPVRPALQALEARAFGYLLEEWLARVPTRPPGASDGLDDLRALREACLQPVPAARPDFAALADALR